MSDLKHARSLLWRIYSTENRVWFIKADGAEKIDIGIFDSPFIYGPMGLDFAYIKDYKGIYFFDCVTMELKFIFKRDHPTFFVFYSSVFGVIRFTHGDKQYFCYKKRTGVIPDDIINSSSCILFTINDNPVFEFSRTDGNKSILCDLKFGEKEEFLARVGVKPRYFIDDKGCFYTFDCGHLFVLDPEKKCAFQFDTPAEYFSGYSQYLELGVGIHVYFKKQPYLFRFDTRKWETTVNPYLDKTAVHGESLMLCEKEARIYGSKMYSYADVAMPIYKSYRMYQAFVGDVRLTSHGYIPTKTWLLFYDPEAHIVKSGFLYAALYFVLTQHSNLLFPKRKYKIMRILYFIPPEILLLILEPLIGCKLLDKNPITGYAERFAERFVDSLRADEDSSDDEFNFVSHLLSHDPKRVKSE